ncbi:hypothetical protein GPECTOR_4g698 [Gonium pectorale]|uniref:BTB domain-containing protein n=1 Tax=Gonium pectorale TaxID=33097 RepID=A0A150GXZ9_GONPE|nr:hypothetical protein GPECTOR_4g698 [Gonium pectorale]|eukprot:KXZ54633.1 hypothetical protein GPECTOR_4g698 [Gonium pectorale]
MLSKGSQPSPLPAACLPSPATHGSPCQAITLSFKSGKTLSADKCSLVKASPVLRDVLSLKLPTSGVLEVGEDSEEAWGVVLGMLDLSAALPVELITWDNLKGVWQLADKYNMRIVHGFCATFLAVNVPCLSLDEPLSSPKNLLKAASMVEQYGGGVPEPGLVAGAVQRAMNCALSAMVQWPVGEGLHSVLPKLGPLVLDKSYASEVSSAVQAVVVERLLAGLCLRSGTCRYCYSSSGLYSCGTCCSCRKQN